LLAAFVAVGFGLGGVRPPRAVLVAGALSLGLVFCTAELLRWLRPLSSNAWIDLGSGAHVPTWPLVGVTAPPGEPLLGRLLSQWLEQAGAPVLLLGLWGVGSALCVARVRRVAGGWLSLLSVCTLAQVAALEGWIAGPPLLPCAWALAWVAFAGFGLQALVGWLWRVPLPYCRAAAVLLLTAVSTLVLTLAEAPAAEDAQSQLGTEVWTEEALGELPANSLLLVRSEVLAYRLIAAQLLGGERPDVVVVPSSWLSRASVTRRLLHLEPELSPLLRQLAVNGYPDEYSLCRLADARPLFVELDPNWDARLLEHLRPGPMWLGFSPHALGESDRRAGFESSRAALSRVHAAARDGGPRDLPTRRALFDLAAQQALTLAALGDRDNARSVMRVLGRLSPDDPLLAELSARLAQTRRGRVEVADLID
jgi:hypothetical protein